MNTHNIDWLKTLMHFSKCYKFKFNLLNKIKCLLLYIVFETSYIYMYRTTGTIKLKLWKIPLEMLYNIFNQTPVLHL